MPRKITPYIVKDVIMCDENKTILEAAEIIAEKNIGSVVVPSSSGKPTCFTERDMATAIAKGIDPHILTLKEVVKEHPNSIKPDATTSECLELMKKDKCRHLLVTEGDKCVGIISLSDVVKLLIDEKDELNNFLNDYIKGTYPE